MSRTILLVDMNSFFASVHQALDPNLREKPVIITGDPNKRRGIVVAASYEAKAYGVKTGMLVGEVKCICPQGIFIKSQYHHYLDFSSRFLAIMREFTPLVEPFSIDEAFLDITGCEGLFGSPVKIASQLKRRIYDKLMIRCSVGIGPNKLLAKMASGLQKPDGLTVLNYKDIPKRLWPLPVRELFGIGPRYERYLLKMGISTIGSLAQCRIERLKKRFGKIGEVFWRCANGLDCSPVNPHSFDQVKSIGQQMTLPRDYQGEEIKVVLWELADLIAQRVRAQNYVGKTVNLFLKDSSLMCFSRAKSLFEYTDLAADIFQCAVVLLNQHWNTGKPVRMVGLCLSNLMTRQSEQISLFTKQEKVKRVEKTCDMIRNRYGAKAILRASSLTEAGVRYV